MNIPLKSEYEYLRLGDSVSIAKKRFLNLEKRFKRDINLYTQYKKFIDDYLNAGYGRYVPLVLQSDRTK